MEVEEHHIGVYSSKTDEHMVKELHSKKLLRGSLVSEALAAAIMNGKYVNAVPLYRLEKEFERYGLAITRQNMVNWIIRLSEEYLAVMYDYLHELLYNYHVIQADKTPVLVNEDGRPAGSKSWMWVYCSGFMYPERFSSQGVPEELYRNLRHRWLSGIPHFRKRAGKPENRRLLGTLQTKV